MKRTLVSPTDATKQRTKKRRRAPDPWRVLLLVHRVVHRMKAVVAAKWIATLRLKQKRETARSPTTKQPMDSDQQTKSAERPKRCCPPVLGESEWQDPWEEEARKQAILQEYSQECRAEEDASKGGLNVDVF